MLKARDIYRLLIEDDPPAEPGQPPPDDPNQLGINFPDPDLIGDPNRDIHRYLDQKPFAVPGTGPTHVFADLVAVLNRRPHRDPNRLRLEGAATYIIRYAHEDGRIAVRYHDTDVVTAMPDGTVIVDSGGWRPGGEYGNMGFSMPAGRTTMARINDWLGSGWRIYNLPIRRNDRQKGEGGGWYWHNLDKRGEKWAYTDGDKILPNGSLQPQRYPEADEFTPVKYEPPR